MHSSGALMFDITRMPARLSIATLLVAIMVASVPVDAQRQAAVMSDRENSQLRGPVHTVSHGFAEIDSQTNDWGPFKQMPTRVYTRTGTWKGAVNRLTTPRPAGEISFYEAAL